MEIYRITDSIWADKLVASGRPARWNSKDVEMLYFEQSASLACLENIVHRSSIELNDKTFVLIIVQSPNDFNVINKNELAVGWNEVSPKAFSICRSIGDHWIMSNSSLLLRVPSVISPNEYNFLVNPKHHDFYKLKIVAVSPFLFDKRVK